MAQKKIAANAAAVLAALLVPRPAAAWSTNGHRAVGLIAQTLLQNAARQGDAASQAALDAIAGLLGPDFSLADLSPCADEIKRLDVAPGSPPPAVYPTLSCDGLTLTVDPRTEPWHYVDVPITDPDTADSVNAHCPNGDCVVAQIKADVSALKDPAALAAAKQNALMFLVHFVGDEHQPLHCATEIVNGQEDRGGNGKQVRFEGLEMNMHALWDHLIQKPDSIDDPVTLAARLAGSLPAGATTQWTQGDFVVGAAVESLGIAEQIVYPAYYAAAGGGTGVSSGAARRGHRRPQTGPSAARGPIVDLPAGYQARMRPIVERRLQRAGVRLAALLKQALGGDASAARAAAKIKSRVHASQR